MSILGSRSESPASCILLSSSINFTVTYRQHTFYSSIYIDITLFYTYYICTHLVFGHKFDPCYYFYFRLINYGFVEIEFLIKQHTLTLKNLIMLSIFCTISNLWDNRKVFIDYFMNLFNSFTVIKQFENWIIFNINILVMSKYHKSLNWTRVGTLRSLNHKSIKKKIYVHRIFPYFINFIFNIRILNWSKP